MAQEIQTQATETTTENSAANSDKTTVVRRPRGFAAMTAEQRSEISRRGGQAAHASGKAHEFSTDEAKAAGQKGGRAAHERRRAAMTTTENT
jgi:general stress protein YciG